MDLTRAKAQTAALLTAWGTTVVLKRLSVSYTTNPPTETWAQASTFLMDIQQRGGRLSRMDPGLAAETTHLGFCKLTEDVIANDRIFIGAATDYYHVIYPDDMVDHLEVQLKLVKGAI